VTDMGSHRQMSGSAQNQCYGYGDGQRCRASVSNLTSWVRGGNRYREGLDSKGSAKPLAGLATRTVARALKGERTQLWQQISAASAPS
jgi:hypothetical protein